MSDNLESLPSLPKFSIKATLARRNKLITFFDRKTGTAPVGQNFLDLVCAVHSILGRKVSYAALSDSLLHLIDTPITRSLAVETSWRLAGNMDRLSSGKAVLPTSWKSVSDWCAAEIVEARPFLLTVQSTKRRRGTYYTFQVITGIACPMLIQVFFSMERTKYTARRLGFPASYRDNHFRDERELVGMRMALWIDPEKATDTGPSFAQIAVNSTFMSENRKLIHKRTRPGGEKGFTCPRDYSIVEVPCYRCPAGRNECKAAVNRLSYVWHMCTTCQQEAWFDPTDNRARDCVECSRRVDLGLV